MTMTTAIAYLRNCMRNGLDTSKYPTAKLIDDITAVCDDFIQRTRATRTTSTVSLVAGTAAYTPSITNFRPEYLLRAYLSDLTNATSDGNAPNLTVTSFQSVYDKIINLAQTGQPTEIGWSGPNAFSVYRIPDANRTLTLLWDPPFDATTPNLPDEYLRSILRWGGTYFAQGQEPEYAATGDANWNRYLDFVARLKGQGAGSLGEMVEYRVPMRGIPSGNGSRRIITDNLN